VNPSHWGPVRDLTSERDFEQFNIAKLATKKTRDQCLSSSLETVMSASRPRRAAALRNRYTPIPPREPAKELLPAVFRTAASPTIPAGVQTPPSAPAISVVTGAPLRPQLSDPTSTTPRPSSAPRALPECAPEVSSIASATSQPSTWSADQMGRIRQAAAIIHQSFATSTRRKKF